MKNQRLFSSILLVCLGALWIFVWGLHLSYDQGLPYKSNDDVYHIRHIETMIDDSTLDPNWYNYPSLFFYANVAALRGYYLFEDFSSFQVQFSIQGIVAKTPNPVHYQIAYGVGLVALTIASYAGYRASQAYLANKIVSLFVGVMVMASPLMFGLATLIRPEPYMMIFLFLTLWLALKIYEGGNWKIYVLGGFCAGLAASSKYNAAFVVVALATAHLLRYGIRKSWRHPEIYMAAVASMIGFALFTPMILVDTDHVLGSLRNESSKYYEGRNVSDPGRTNALGYYAKQFVKWYTVLVPLGFYGLIAIWRRKEWKFLIPLSYALVYFAVISRYAGYKSPVMAPLLPVVILMFAAGIHYLYEILQTHHTAVVVALAGTVAVSLIPIAYQDYQRIDLLRTRDQNQQVVRDWVTANVAPGTVIATDYVYVDTETYSIHALGDNGRSLESLYAKAYDIIITQYKLGRLTPDQVRIKAMYDQVMVVGTNPPLAVFRFPQSQNNTPSLLFENGDVALIAQTPRTEFVQCETAYVRTDWRAEVAPRYDYQVTLLVSDAEGRPYVQNDDQLAFSWTTGWQAGEWHVHIHELEIPCDLPAGQYELRLGLYELVGLSPVNQTEYELLRPVPVQYPGSEPFGEIAYLMDIEITKR